MKRPIAVALDVVGAVVGVPLAAVAQAPGGLPMRKLNQALTSARRTTMDQSLPPSMVF